MALGSVAGAQSSTRAVMTGTVMECAPGPVVESPPAPEPKPQPLTVTLFRGGRVYESEHVALPLTLPWTGTYRFSALPGRYEVVSSYQHHVRWVNLTAGAHVVVNFNTFMCPL